MTCKLLILVCFSLAFLQLSRCGNIEQGGQCSTDNNRVDPVTHKFLAECDDKTFCPSANGTCQPKGCRRDEFPFGYGSGDILPLLCPHGTFCPDDGSACRGLAAVGQPCEMDRDEQCAPPATSADLSNGKDSEGPIGICLFATCMYTNATIGQHCVLDHEKYIDVGADGQQFSNDIFRHNCQAPQLYCDPSSLQCFRAKPTGEACVLDLECRSSNCEDGICRQEVGTPPQIPMWQYVLSILLVAAAMGTTGTSLVILHKRLRVEHRRQLREYYHEQISLRRSMFALHHHAASSNTHREKYHGYTQ